MVTPLDTSAQLAIDANSLDQLRAQAQQSPDKALKAVSKQFEVAVRQHDAEKHARSVAPGRHDG